MMIRVETTAGVRDEYPDATKYHIDEAEHLHVIGEGSGNLATYARGTWTTVSTREAPRPALLAQRLVMDAVTSSGGLASFATDSREDAEGRPIIRAITLAADDVADMGNPEQITVTIEPGDLLSD